MNEDEKYEDEHLIEEYSDKQKSSRNNIKKKAKTIKMEKDEEYNLESEGKKSINEVKYLSDEEVKEDTK